MKTNPTNRFQSAVRLLTVILAGCSVALQATAAIYTWDADGTAPVNDGAGTWNATGGTNWVNGATYGVWGNTTADEAIFGVNNGAADAITVGTVTANKLTFNAPGSASYTLASGTIALGGTNPTLTANTNAWINSAITSTAATAFVRGVGTLSLGGTATFTGGQGLYRYVPANSTGGFTVVAGANITAKNFSLMQDNVSNLTQTYNQAGGTVNVTGEFGLNQRRDQYP